MPLRKATAPITTLQAPNSLRDGVPIEDTIIRTVLRKSYERPTGAPQSEILLRKISSAPNIPIRSARERQEKLDTEEVEQTRMRVREVVAKHPQILKASPFQSQHASDSEAMDGV